MISLTGKKSLAILLITFFILPITSIGWTNNKSIKYDSSREHIETIITGVIVGGSIYLSIDKTPWFSEPNITSGSIDKPYREDTVPSWTVGVAGLGLLSGIIFIPNNDGYLNHTSYANAKGFIQAIGLTNLSTGIAKHSIGRKRPDYGDRVARNIDVEDGLFSFWSGHASTSFSIATYSSLFVLDHVGDWDNGWHIAGKVVFSTGFMSLATWVAYTRVDDNRHHVEDVIVGSLVGTGISFVIYGYQNEWFSQRYNRLDTKPQEARHINFNLLPNMVSLTFNF